MKIRCDCISKVYQSKTGSIQALDGVSFETAEHEFLCILGPSGCGKTTLLKIIAGLLDPSAGHCEFVGQIRSNKPLNSMVFQEHGLFPWMNIIDNVAFGLEMRGTGKKVRYDRATAVMQKVGLTGVLLNYPHELSVGMKQRAGLARAIANDPEVYLMDEPFGSLDAQTKLILQDEFLRIWTENRTPIIFVTHDIEEAVLLGDRVLVFSSSPGRIKEEIVIDLPRPRDMEIKGSREFVAIKMRIWHLIEHEVKKAMR